MIPSRWVVYITLLCLFSFSGLALTQPHAATFVSCQSQDVNANFTVGFTGHPTEEKTIQADFISGQGAPLYSWSEPINGIARRGFIKIAQSEITGPYSRLNTAILSGFNPSIPINTPFEATYRQWVDTVWEPQSNVVEYRLICSSPY